MNKPGAANSKKNQKFFYNNQFFIVISCFLLLKIFYFIDKPIAANEKKSNFFYSNQFFYTTKNSKNFLFQGLIYKLKNGLIYSTRRKCCLASIFLHYIIIKKFKKFYHSI